MIKKAYFAAGCFWGVETLFKKLEGVVSTSVGYSGGGNENPTYEEVCSGQTGHFEAIEVEYDPDKVSYEELVKYFFSIHDFEQVNGQGPDIGEQYLSRILYVDEEQRGVAENLIEELSDKGYEVLTELINFEKYWPAEDYHQDYYQKTGKIPYCHVYKPIW